MDTLNKQIAVIDADVKARERAEARQVLASQISAGLSGFNGTDHHYKHFLGRLHYTDGVKWLAEKAGAYWLIDIVASYQMKLARRPEDTSFQVWTLKVKDGNGVVTCAADSDEVPFITQKIPHTDFSLDEIKLFVEGTPDTRMVLLLPSEH